MTTHNALNLALLCCLPAALQGGEPAPEKTQTIRLLTVGNSFAWNATKYLPEIVGCVPGCKLLLASANVGGGPLNQHYDMMTKSEKDPAYKPYGFRNPVTHKYSKVNLREALTALDWDIVTMQQYSAYSYLREKWDPYFDLMVAYIKKHAPGAKIYIHQTWAYRSDAGRFQRPDFSQEKMYALLTENYRHYAGKYHFPIIPVGAAFQLCRKTEKPSFTFPDPNFDYEHPPHGKLPNQAGSLNVGYVWNKEGKFVHDTHHANHRGCYLAGCVWFEVLYGIDARKIAFTPEDLDPTDAEFLRRTAHQAVATFPQVPGADFR